MWKILDFQTQKVGYKETYEKVGVGEGGEDTEITVFIT